MRHFFAFAQLVRLPNTFSAMADILLDAGDRMGREPVERIPATRGP